MVGVERFELPTSCSQSRRATRLRYTPKNLRPRAKALDNTRPPYFRQRIGGLYLKYFSFGQSRQAPCSICIVNAAGCSFGANAMAVVGCIRAPVFHNGQFFNVRIHPCFSLTAGKNNQ